jgi:hypothetical protein
VKRLRLQLNYRSASRIVSASETALEEKPGYHSNDPERQAIVSFVGCDGGVGGQSAHALEQIIPEALAAKPDRPLGDIAILYRQIHWGRSPFLDELEARMQEGKGCVSCTSSTSDSGPAIYGKVAS